MSATAMMPGAHNFVGGDDDDDDHWQKRMKKIDTDTQSGMAALMNTRLYHRMPLSSSFGIVCRRVVRQQEKRGG